MLVTGAASGIGLELATELHQRGARVMAADVDQSALAARADERWRDRDRIALSHLDVRDPDHWQETIELALARWGKLDTVLNVAGCLSPGWAHDLTRDQVDRMIDVNVKGVIFGTNAAARTMIAQSSGHIVNVASIAALVAVPGLAVYSATKHAVRAFSLAVAEELRAHGIFVTVVCPGPVQTPMLDAQLHHDEAAMTFSAPRPLAAAEVTRAIVDRALESRPLELTVTVPLSGQAAMARLINAIPELAPIVSPLITRLGRRQQRRMRS
jgi:3-oxoacyl-[acyl-carrier protein] reductase